MTKTKLEISDPGLWLREVCGDRDGFARLVRESRGMVRAAYRVARAHARDERCEAPSLADLQVTIALLAAALGTRAALPIQSLLPAARLTSRKRPSAPDAQAVAHSAPPPPASMRH